MQKKTGKCDINQEENKLVATDPEITKMMELATRILK